jgi:hypothetical protein
MVVSEFLPFVNLLLFAAVGWTIFWLSKRIHSSWLRIPIRAIASTVGFLGAAVLVMLSVFEPSCTKHASPIKSPDGRHVAVLSFAMQGALGDDYANVGVRPWWSPRAQNVYKGVGAWDFEKGQPFDPEVHWLDSRHLLIRYGIGLPVCRSRLGEIEIVCQPLR